MPSFNTGLLWQLKGSPYSPPSYLFGTMHVRDKRAFSLRDTVFAHILECEALACEVDVSDPENTFPGDALLLPPGRLLSDLVRPKQWMKMCRMLEKAFGIYLPAYQHLQPIFIQQLISEQMLSEDLPEALDAHLLAFARQHQIPTLGLETVAQQMEVLAKIPLEKQLESLLKTSRNVGKFRQYFLRLTLAYEQENIQRIYRSTYQSLGKLRRIMLFQRNQRMADRIVQEMEERAVFFAVGAAHLAGGKGILRKLKQQGIHIRPILSSN